MTLISQQHHMDTSHNINKTPKLETTHLLTDRTAAANRRLAKVAVQCLNEALCFISGTVLAENLVLQNPPAPARILSCGK
jgi:hypothetical protein